MSVVTQDSWSSGFIPASQVTVTGHMDDTIHVVTASSELGSFSCHVQCRIHTNTGINFQLRHEILIVALLAVYFFTYQGGLSSFPSNSATIHDKSRPLFIFVHTWPWFWHCWHILLVSFRDKSNFLNSISHKYQPCRSVSATRSGNQYWYK